MESASAYVTLFDGPKYPFENRLRLYSQMQTRAEQPPARRAQTIHPGNIQTTSALRQQRFAMHL